jgi:hypothetical protein
MMDGAATFFDWRNQELITHRQAHFIEVGKGLYRGNIIF